MATKARAKRTRTKRPRQPFLHESMEPPHHLDIDDAAENYYEVMMERCKLSKEEDEKKDALIDKMKEHGLDRYETPEGLVITITAKSNVKAKKKKDTAEENGNGEA